MVPCEHVTTDFLITQTGSDPAVEIWVDWVPAADGDPEQPVTARRDGEDLVVEPCLRAGGPGRRLQGLQPNVWTDLARETLVWRVCGPSGVLGEHRMRVEGA